MTLVKRQSQTAEYKSNKYITIGDLREFVKNTTELHPDAQVTAVKLDREENEYGTDKARFCELSAKHVVTVKGSFDLQKGS